MLQQTFAMSKHLDNLYPIHDSLNSLLTSKVWSAVDVLNNPITQEVKHAKLKHKINNWQKIVNNTYK